MLDIKATLLKNVTVEGVPPVPVEWEWFDSLVDVALSLQRNAEEQNLCLMIEEIETLVQLVREYDLGRRSVPGGED